MYYLLNFDNVATAFLDNGDRWVFKHFWREPFNCTNSSEHYYSLRKTGLLVFVKLIFALGKIVTKVLQH